MKKLLTILFLFPFLTFAQGTGNPTTISGRTVSAVTTFTPSNMLMVYDGTNLKKQPVNGNGGFIPTNSIVTQASTITQTITITAVGSVTITSNNGTNAGQQFTVTVGASSAISSVSITAIGSLTITSNNGNNAGSSFTITVGASGSTLLAGSNININAAFTISVSASPVFSGTATAAQLIATDGVRGTTGAFSGTITASEFIGRVRPTAATTFSVITSGTLTVGSNNTAWGNYTGTTSATAFKVEFDNIADGATVKALIYKTTASNSVITFPTGTVISEGSNANVTTTTLTLTTIGESTSSVYMLYIERVGSIYVASVTQLIN